MFLLNKTSVVFGILIIGFVCKGGGGVAFFKSHSYHTKKPKFNFCQVYYSNLFSLGFGFINITYLLSVILIILQKSGDIETNPGPSQIEKLKTLDQYYKEKNRTDDNLKFCYMNCRSLNNKYEKLSNFLTTLDQLSFLAVTETWIKENNTIPDSFLSSSHQFIHQSRSSSTELERGGGVGIWIPNKFSIKMRNDLNTINRSFFESLWIEVIEPLKEKLLMNVAYCSNVNLSKFFLDEMTSEISNVYSSTDNLILFGDFNINILKETGKQLLNNFFADNGLQCVNTKKQHGQMEKNFL